MKLYNTLTRQLEELHFQQASVVSVYTCGPTVYDYAHIGHWFTYVRMDILIRTLKANQLSPKWVMNITDVGHLVSDADEGQDKLEKGAAREGKTAWQVAEFYTEDFLQGMQLLNLSKPTHIVKATEHINEQIELIRTLETKGYTYVIDDGVYYDTAKFPHYADFAQLDLDEQQAGARVALNPQKRNATDFALWKFSPDDHQRDMEWDSPWGKGFPGWHIECSAMSMKYLGPTLDIHTGGIDHVPVHHTNEIAQSEAATGQQFAKYWMHTNHVMVDGEKISKSLANGIRLQEIGERGIPPEALRLHVLESHYRSQSRFSWESLEAANNRLRELRAMAALRWQARATVNDETTFTFSDVPLELINALSNDLNTPQVLTFLSQITTQVLAILIHPDMLAPFETMLEDIDKLLGLNLLAEVDIDTKQKALLHEREQARLHKNWQHADSLRAELEQDGVLLRDTAHGAIWFRA